VLSGPVTMLDVFPPANVREKSILGVEQVQPMSFGVTVHLRGLHQREKTALENAFSPNIGGAEPVMTILVSGAIALLQIL